MIITYKEFQNNKLEERLTVQDKTGMILGAAVAIGTIPITGAVITVASVASVIIGPIVGKILSSIEQKKIVKTINLNFNNKDFVEIHDIITQDDDLSELRKEIGRRRDSFLKFLPSYKRKVDEFNNRLYEKLPSHLKAKYDNALNDITKSQLSQNI